MQVAECKFVGGWGGIELEILRNSNKNESSITMCMLVRERLAKNSSGPKLAGNHSLWLFNCAMLRNDRGRDLVAALPSDRPPLPNAGIQDFQSLVCKEQPAARSIQLSAR